MNLQPHFEICVRQQGRWVILSQYPPSEEKAAIEEAKELDKQTEIEAVKLILEVRNNKTGTRESHLIYKSAGVTTTNDEIDSTVGLDYNISNKRETTGYRSETLDLGRSYSTSLPTNVNIPPNGSPTRLLAKILLILVISLFLASMAAFVAIESIAETAIFGSKMSGSQTTHLVIGVFAVIFIVSAGLLSFSYIKVTDFNFRRSHGNTIKSYSRKSQSTSDKNSDSQKKSDAKRKLNNVMAGSKDISLQDQPADIANNVEGQNSAGYSSEAKSLPQTIDTLSPNAEVQKVYLIEFLHSSMSKPGDEPQKLDSFKMFGINLFLAGACQKLADKRGVDYRSRIWILTDCLQSLGLKKSHAAAFADKYEGYLIQDPHYMEMYQAGLNAMENHLKDPTNSISCLENALKEWNQSERALEEKRPITLLISKISSPTTRLVSDQSHPEEGLKVHNDVVRKALTENNGFEINMSKIGIIASFDKASDSLDAAIQIQRAALTYSRGSPSAHLNIKIAINTSAPPVDERDSFENMTQTCESIASIAQFDEIFVADVVRGACKGGGYTFSSKGAHQITGFQGAIDLYEVLWRVQPVS